MYIGQRFLDCMLYKRASYKRASHSHVDGHTRVLMRDERRKEERSKQYKTNNKAKQHSTSKAVTFPKKNELPRVGLKPTTLYYTCTCFNER